MKEKPKFTRANARVVPGVYYKQIKQKNYAIILPITLLFTLITHLQTSAVESTQTVQKELPAVKTDQPPTIDGVLNDACWQDALQAIVFTDERTEKPAKTQSVGRVVYTDTAIYVGLHLIFGQETPSFRIKGMNAVWHSPGEECPLLSFFLTKSAKILYN